MVSDSELIDRLREFLRVSDLNTTTTAIVRRKLEEDFGVDLSDRKAFIRQQVDLFLQTEENKEEEEEEEEEEEKKPKVKSEANNGSDSEQEEEESEEENSEEEEGSSSNGKGRKKNKKKKQVKDKDVKKRGGGFAKVCSLSPELQKFVGVPELARTEVVRQLWAYIREKDLQDPENRRNIRCDEALRALFRVDTINMFQMNKALSRHIWPLESENADPVMSTPKEKKPKPKPKPKSKSKSKRERNEDSDETRSKEKRRKGSGSGFLAPLPLSDALVKFIGTGENILPRSTVVKKIWDYIKQNNLQDPLEKTKVICDDKLKELFEVDSFVGFTVPKLLKDHFIKAAQ